LHGHRQCAVLALWELRTFAALAHERRRPTMTPDIPAPTPAPTPERVTSPEDLWGTLVPPRAELATLLAIHGVWLDDGCGDE
jgi:hypothetical protein